MASGARMLSFAFWYTAAVSLITVAAIWALGCTGEIQRGFLEHPEDPGVCRLIVENDTPYMFRFRVGNLWWKGQDGLAPYDKGTLLVDQDKKYVLTRRFDVNGLAWEDEYEFYIPKGMGKHTVTFGGLQVGVLYNRCDEPAKVFSPFRNGSFIIPPGGSHAASAIPGNPAFVVYFGPNWEHWVQVSFKVTAVRRDASFNGAWVDWVGYIDPKVREEATTGWRGW